MTGIDKLFVDHAGAWEPIGFDYYDNKIIIKSDENKTKKISEKDMEGK